MNNNNNNNNNTMSLHKGKEKVDVEVINNAGYALYGAFKETSIHEIKAQFETNFLAQ
jgi:short-subunit dehydrogenase